MYLYYIPYSYLLDIHDVLNMIQAHVTCRMKLMHYQILNHCRGIGALSGSDRNAFEICRERQLFM